MPYRPARSRSALALDDPVAVLHTILGCPTAPFHEAYVAATIAGLAQDAGFTCQVDPYGNLLVWYRPDGDRPSGASGGDGRPTLALSAHMDHPGLEIVQERPLAGRLLGFIRPECFSRPVDIVIIDGDERVSGRITGLLPSDQLLAPLERHLPGEAPFRALALEAERPVSADAFAVMDVGPVRTEAGLIHAGALDDLAGCAAALCVLQRCRERQLMANVVGVFTRCEELGVIGATLVARQRLLPPDALIISIETSRTLPGAEIGQGPVIRVGDRTSAFDPFGDAILRRAAARLDVRRPGVRVQRQLLSGGTCEATSYQSLGWRTTGVAFAVAHLHNMSPDLRIVPEHIHQDDYLTGIDLMVEAAAALAEPEDRSLIKHFNALADAAALRLQHSAASWPLTEEVACYAGDAQTAS